MESFLREKLSNKRYAEESLTMALRKSVEELDRYLSGFLESKRKTDADIMEQIKIFEDALTARRQWEEYCGRMTTYDELFPFSPSRASNHLSDLLPQFNTTFLIAPGRQALAPLKESDQTKVKDRLPFLDRIIGDHQKGFSLGETSLLYKKVRNMMQRFSASQKCKV
eukprot:GHVP01018474.1.p1 GENE.GHVP01018474.1~~GHVP01018474.1.p1  ORF type:complete len:167 (+),score=26.37 GHVP01018474.1:887-1387(+)